jgi:hypothetical protein
VIGASVDDTNNTADASGAFDDDDDDSGVLAAKRALEAAKEILGVANLAAAANPSDAMLAAAVSAAKEAVTARKGDVQGAKDAETAAAAATAIDAGNSTTVVIVVAVVLILLVVAGAVATRNKIEGAGGETSDDAVVAFENPMYGNAGSGGGQGRRQQVADIGSHGYQDVAPHASVGRGAGAGGGGYMDVSGTTATAGYMDVAGAGGGGYMDVAANANPDACGGFDSDDEEV